MLNGVMAGAGGLEGIGSAKESASKRWLRDFFDRNAISNGASKVTEEVTDQRASAARWSGFAAGSVAPWRPAVSAQRGHEAADMRRDLGRVRFQGEMAGVEQDDLGIGQVAAVGLRAGRQEVRIVPPPDGEERRAVRAEILRRA